MATATDLPKPGGDFEVPAMPVLGAVLPQNAAAAARYLEAMDQVLKRLGPPAISTGEKRQRFQELSAQAGAFREAFFRRHMREMYDTLTNGCTTPRRVKDLVYAAAERYPGLLPTRAEIDAERAAGSQLAKFGREIAQGLFIAYVLADERCGLHLMHAMLRPMPEAEARLGEFRRTGRIDLGVARVERKDNAGHVTLTNAKFLNAEDDAAVAALETAVDLVLLDEAIEVGVLRGGVLDHPKYKGRRVFNAGINLTHLYYGQISVVEFFLERELGLLHKMFRGLWTSGSYREQLEDYVEKPWLAVVESFAIGGGCQLLCIMDRVIAEPGAYFTLPASREGFIPGAANLRLPRLAGLQLTRQAIYFDRQFRVDTPEGMMICDEVVPAAEMDEAVWRTTQQMVQAGLLSAVSNRKCLRVGQEPLDMYRRYMATYARQQCLCVYDLKLLENLEHSWKPQQRRM